MVASTMGSLFVALFALVTSSFRARAARQVEILALRHQLARSPQERAASPAPQAPPTQSSRPAWEPASPWNNLLNRQMRPLLNRCKHCGLVNGKAHAHAKNPHRFERDPRLPEWHGWHAARRGLSTNLNRLGVPDKVIQLILRHSNVQVTQNHYIKPADADVVAAMGKFEAKIAAHGLLDSNRTVNRTVRKSVN
jgi:Phage integrase family